MPARTERPGAGAGSSAPCWLSPEEVGETAAWIASLQLRDGMVPWYRGGHADPWNHVEAAMALACAGRWAEVGRAFDWLAAKQHEDGSWCTGYVLGGVVEPRRDPNACAYVATGLWWCTGLGGGRSLLEEFWPMVERALHWCLLQQRPGGEIVWSVDPDGVRGTFALLAATSSFQLSLRCAAEAATELRQGPSPWLEAAERATAAVARGCRAVDRLFAGQRGSDGASSEGRASDGRASDGRASDGRASGGRASDGRASDRAWPGSDPRERAAVFAPKDRWAMDWYYPVLTGALAGEEARRRVADRWQEFIEPGLGVRCVSDRYWVTAAETAEFAMAASRAGFATEAAELLDWTRHLRHPSGAYWTGCAHPECVRFPGGQLSTYSAAAVVIADHVLSRRSPAAGVFSGPGEVAAASEEA